MNMKKRFVKQKKDTEFVLASFSLYGHPRFKGGHMSSDNYLGWSKPIIKILEFRFLRLGKVISFGNRKVMIAEFSGDGIVLQIDKEKGNAGDTEKMVLKPNKPTETGFDPLCDASRAYYLGCWTSWGRFLQYYLGVKGARWIDERRARLIELPSYYSANAIKRRWKFRWRQLKYKAEDVFGPGRRAKWR